MIKLKKIKLWPNSITQIVIKLKTGMVTKLKNSNGDQTKKHKLWQNSCCDKTLIVPTQNVRKKSKTLMFQISDCDSSDGNDRSGWKIFFTIFFFFSTKKSNKKLKHKLWWNSKFKIVIKLKNLNCDKNSCCDKNQNVRKNQKLKLWENSKIKILIKLKNSNGDKTTKNLIVTKFKNSKCDKTQLVTKHKLEQSSNCDKTHIVTKLEMQQNSNCGQTQVLRKKIKNLNEKICIVAKLENSNYDNSKTQIVTKKKKTQIGTKLEIWHLNLWRQKNPKKESFSKNILHLDNRWDILWAAICDSRDVLKRRLYCMFS